MKTVEVKDYLLVEVPENAKDFMLLTKAGERDFWGLPSSVMDRIDLYANGIYNTPIAILNLTGNYQIIGLAKDLTEEQWKGIVDYQTDHELDTWYKNYTDDSAWFLDNAPESGHSLLKSHGLENPLILKKVV